MRIRFCHMSHTVTVRLPEDLANWLQDVARRRGLSRSQIIKDQLEKARRGAPDRPFMKLAGRISALAPGRSPRPRRSPRLDFLNQVTPKGVRPRPAAVSHCAPGAPRSAAS